MYLLKNYQNSFEIETVVLSEAKCLLLENNELEDYETSIGSVYVNKTSDGYELIYEDYVFNLETYEKMITSYDVSHS